MQKPARQIGGYLSILLASIFWGASVVMARVLLHYVPSIALAHLTAIFAAGQLAILFLVMDRKLFVIQRPDLWRLVAIGTFGFAAGSLLINIAITRTGPAMAVTLQYLSPALILCWDRWKGAERLTAVKVVALMSSVTGCALTAGLGDKAIEFDPRGVFAAICSASAFAFVTIFGKPVTRRCNPLTFTFYGFLAASIALSFCHDPREMKSAFDPEVLTKFLIYASLLGVVPPVLFFRGLRTVTPTAAGIICSFEIVITSVGAWLCLGEGITMLQSFGAGMVMLAVILIERSREDVESTEPEGKPAVDSAEFEGQI